MIGFIVRIASFAVSVDKAERVTGFDFFNELDDDGKKNLETQNNFSMWEH